jgi:hypothetical protein
MSLQQQYQPTSSSLSTPGLSTSLVGQKLISEKKIALVYFLIVLVISFIVYSVIYYLVNREKCSKPENDCYKAWNFPIGYIWLTSLVAFGVAILLWLLTYFVLTNIQIIN